MDDWQPHGTDNRNENTYTSLGTRHVEANTHTLNRYPRWSEGASGPLTEEPDRRQMEEPANLLLGLAAGQGGLVPPGFRYSPESPEDPADRGQLVIHEEQPTAVVPPVARPVAPPAARPSSPRRPSSLLTLTVSNEDQAHLSNFLNRPVEQYSPEELHAEIGGMPTRAYVAMKIGLTRAARQQLQRIRRQAYQQTRERGLRNLQHEVQTLRKHLTTARQSAIDLHNRLRQQQEAYDRAKDTIAHLRQTQTLLARLCSARLPQDSNTMPGPSNPPRGGGERSSLRTLPSHRPHSPEHRREHGTSLHLPPGWGFTSRHQWGGCFPGHVCRVQLGAQQ
ncbi:uncharacterized protein isoform X2 [Takifugu rubripes]|nr:uncharacterized protein LOC115249606 isoform X2 [Takifugu rubripes]